MRARSIGPSELKVSAVGLGCMSMTPIYGEPDEGECIATVQRAIELGITLIDTADMYGGGGATRSWSAARFRAGATRSCWRASSATSATPTATRT